MSASDAGAGDRRRSDGGNGRNFTVSGKVPSFSSLLSSARWRRSRAKNDGGVCDSCGGPVAAGMDSGSSGKKRVVGGGGCLGRAFCVGRPRALEAPVASRSSDPNDPAFSQEMMRASLEKNDFYSKECNPHLSR
ncbi:uncharacterized protein LOC115694364 [Syzygium oleosum]|uniref:uncharacterized protein LOC115694364 n=1 Tax=Syzygium oleosum TaxID=219896 RepID=UPI0024BAC9A6|nr:uncharacterized protein LOC115694364 [Syzygium oleosum]